MSPVLRVGILGASQHIQTTFLPTLASLPTYKITTIYDKNNHNAQTAEKKFNIPLSKTPHDLISSTEVDVVLNLLPFEYHEQFTIAALEAGKHVMVEIPLSLSIHGLRRIRAAMQKGSTHNINNNPPKVFVGCARRYAPCYTDVFKKELLSLDRIYYARCRNIAGPLHVPRDIDMNIDMNMSTNGHNNGTANGNSNTNTRLQSFQNDLPPLPMQKQFQSLLTDIFGSTDDLTPDRIAFCRFLGNLGCHDLSLMRESLGFPDAVANIAITDPFYSAIFHYADSKVDADGDTEERASRSNSQSHPFTVLYETGVDSVPRCDAHLTVYGASKTISVEYDFPCLVSEDGKGGSVRVVVEELEEKGVTNAQGYGSENGNGNGARLRVKRTEVVSSAAEAYEREFLAMHSYFVGDSMNGNGNANANGRGPEAKTTTNDALMDLRLLHMIFDHYDRQCGTIRTPLG